MRKNLGFFFDPMQDRNFCESCLKYILILAEYLNTIILKKKMHIEQEKRIISIF